MRPTLLLALVLSAAGSACTSRPHHRQTYAFGFRPFLGLRGPRGPGGIDIELFPPAAYANAFHLVSANVSPTLVEVFVFPVSLGWEIGTDPDRCEEAPPAPPKERRKEKPTEAKEKPVEAGG